VGDRDLVIPVVLLFPWVLWGQWPPGFRTSLLHPSPPSLLENLETLALPERKRKRDMRKWEGKKERMQERRERRERRLDLISAEHICTLLII
jgi:hypothetical protein